MINEFWSTTWVMHKIYESSMMSESKRKTENDLWSILKNCVTLCWNNQHVLKAQRKQQDYVHMKQHKSKITLRNEKKNQAKWKKNTSKRSANYFFTFSLSFLSFSFSSFFFFFSSFFSSSPPSSFSSSKTNSFKDDRSVCSKLIEWCHSDSDVKAYYRVKHI